MFSNEAQQMIDHWQHSTRRSATWLGGQGLVLLTGTSVAGVATHAANGGASLGAYALGSLGIGLSIAVRVFMVNDKHSEDMKFFSNFYRPEIASVLGLPENQVGEAELRRAAASVPNLQQALNRADKERDAKIASWIGGGLLAGLLLFTIAVPLLTTGLTIGGLTIAGLEMGKLAGLLAVGANMALFPLAKNVVESGVNRLMHIGEPTAHHHIEDISIALNRSPPKNVTEADVFEVFMAANPAMRQELEGVLGHPFSQLDKASGSAILKQYGAVLELENITRDLNEKRLRPQELAFIASGMRSGVKPPAAAEQDEIHQAAQQLEMHFQKGKEKAAELVEEGKEKLTHARHQAAQKFQAMRSSMHRAQAHAEHWQEKAVGVAQKAPEQSWQDHAQAQESLSGALLTR